MPDSTGFVQDTEPFRRELLAHCYRMLGTTTVSVKSALPRARARLREPAPAADQIAEPTESQTRALLDQCRGEARPTEH